MITTLRSYAYICIKILSTDVSNFAYRFGLWIWISVAALHVLLVVFSVAKEEVEN